MIMSSMLPILMAISWRDLVKIVATLGTSEKR
jgi:hypothetical protein